MILLLTGTGRVDARMLGCDVAGAPLARALTAALRAHPAVRAYAMAAPGPPPDPALAAADDGGGVLVADVDVWFDPAAADGLARAVSRAAGPLRLRAGGDTLAVHLPPPLAPRALGGGAGLPACAADVALAEGEWEDVDARSLGAGGAPARVRTMVELAACEAAVLRARAEAAALAGVRIRDLGRVAIRGELRCGAGVEIDLDVLVEGTVVLGDGVRVGSHCILIDCTLGDGCSVRPFSLVENAVVGAGSSVGPYARLRPGSAIGPAAQIGTFVEIKNAEVGAGARINHLAFVGDSSVGSGATLGAGTITCNHDGAGVARTVIGEGAYVGSGTQLVAPVTVGRDATIGAGSTITGDAPAGTLTLARARQVTVPGWRPRGARGGTG